MKALRTWSAARQLAVGFTCLILILVGLLGTVFHLHSRVRQAEHAFVTEIKPRREQADHLQRAIMYVGLNLRSYLLRGTPSHKVRFRQAMEEARRATHGLMTTGMDGEELSLRVEEYLAKSLDAVERRAHGPIPLSDEVELAGLREELVEEVRQLSHQQESRARSALQRMARLREQVWQGVLGASLLALLGFVTTGVSMARSLRRSTQELLSMATAVTGGDWRPALALVPPAGDRTPPPRSEMGRIARAFGVMAWHLERRERRLLAEGEIARLAASSLDPASFGEPSLRTVLEYLGTEVGVLYLWDEQAEALVPAFCHAVESEERVLRGQGIPGQAAASRRTVVLRDIPRESAFRVKLGYDEAPPKCVVATPVIAHDHLFGVLLVASLRELEQEDFAFLERAASQLGVGLANAKAYRTTQTLLEEVRERSELIQAQNAQLQAQNEAIQAQSKQLRAQQEEIQAQNEALKQRAEELERQAQQLRVVSERKTEFLGVLAHELRNPLAPIVNGLYLLGRAEVEGEQRRRALSVLERQVEHLTKLVDDLLDVTRIARGKVSLDLRPLDLVALVRACVEDQRGAIEARGLQLRVELPQGEVLVKGDRTRLSQVVGNLLHNASKFTDAEGWIAVRLRAGSDEVELRVADSGIGIEPSLMAQLFTPFVQGNTQLARSSGGLGLGLALVRSLVDLHGGSVTAHSEGAGRGAEFTVKLPRLHVAGGSIQPGDDPQERPRSMQVLLIEDSQDAAETLRAVLELQGHRVAVAYSGADGLRLACELVPEVILCDLGLPVLSGYEVAARVRAEPRLANVLLVAVSGYASHSDRRRAVKAGFDHHLAKPLGLEQIQQIFAMRRRSNQPPRA